MYFLNILIITPLLTAIVHSAVDRPTFLVAPGRDAVKGEALYHAALRTIHKTEKEVNVICGGALISQTIVLTSAHCICLLQIPIPVHYIKVSGGNYIRDALDAPTTYVSTAKRIIVHPEYNDETFSSDIALVELNERVDPRHKTFKPIKIANIIIPDGTACLLSGWGSTNVTEYKIVERLQIGTTHIMTSDECKKALKDIKTLPICTVGGAVGCKGDGGSPLVCKGKLIGIVSYGYGCGNTSQYTIHTDIRKHYQWVKENECTSLRPIWTFSLLLTVLIFM